MLQENITLCEESVDRLKARFADMSLQHHNNSSDSLDLQGSQTQLEKKLDTVVKARFMQLQHVATYLEFPLSWLQKTFVGFFGLEQLLVASAELLPLKLLNRFNNL